ncbi:MAG: antibiotic ABC transporter permease [Bacteroidetes bacterium]|nr:MAG: antibiotic ABC transporter permease [Bacteroidota bacterium]
MIKNYFKTALRSLKSNKVFSIINVSGLCLGLTCVMLIILYVKDEVSYDRFHANAMNIYRVTDEEIKPDGSKENESGITGLFQGPKFTSKIPEMKEFVRLQNGFENIKMQNEIKSQEAMYVDSNFFSLFTFPLISGDPKTALSDPNSIVLSEETAEKYFGSPNAVGKTLLLEDENTFKPHIVTGVAKKCPQNSSIKFEMLMPFKVSAKDMAENTNWFNFFLNTFILLDPKANIKTVEAKMKTVYENDAKESIKEMADKYDVKNKTVYHLQPYTEMHLSKKLPVANGLGDASNPMYSYILSGIAIFILLIACINFVNLTVARSVKRAREIGIRKVVGGSKRQLIIQFLGESFLLCLIAFVFAIVLVKLALPVFNTLSNKALSISYLFDVKLVAGYFLLFLLTGLLAGFYPAIVLSNYNPVQTLYSRFNLAGKNYLQKTLVVIQFALASFLIIATLVVYSQFNFLTTEKLGYDDSNLVAIHKNGLKHEEVKLFKEQLLQSPNIIDVAPKNGGSWGTVAKINGDSTIQFAYETVDETYLPLMKIPLVKGRLFSKDFPSDSTHSLIVNEAFVKKAGWKDPIGQEINFWYRNEKYNVVGVVKDHHYESLEKEIGPQVYTMKPANNFGMVYIKIKPNSEKASLAHIEKVFKYLFPMNPYSYEFRDQINFKNYESEAKWKKIMLFSAILTIFISCIGLFGLSVFAAEKRTKEVGIRKVLGASVGNVAGILSKDFMKLVLIALVISIPLAWYFSSKWLMNYAYRIEMNWKIFGFAAFVVIFIAVFTVSFQAIKAAISNPVKSLRTE